jgi:predicted lactoylglutathione lyase
VPMLFVTLPVRDLPTARAFYLHRGLTDPGGHVWQVMWMDQLHEVN